MSGFFVYLIFLALLDYSSSIMLLMTLRMCKIFLKSPLLTVMSRVVVVRPSNVICFDLEFF